LAQGTPMLAAGSEFGHTQHGNNNAYCQDSALSWLDWEQADETLLAYVRHLVKLRCERLPLRNAWYHGLRAEPSAHDLEWLVPEGGPLQGEAWHHSELRCLGALIHEPGRSAQALLLLINGEHSRRDFQLPRGRWGVLLDSSCADGAPAGSSPLSTSASLPAQSVWLLEQLP
jgi:glycogen operon protein